MKTARFEAKICQAGINSFINIPDRIWQALASGRQAGRLRVDGLLNDVAFRATILPAANGLHRMYLNEGLRKRAGVAAGQKIHVTLQPASTAETVPAEIVAELSGNPAALAAFSALSPSHRRELLRFIDDAKSKGSRRQRIQQTADHVLGKAIARKAGVARARTRPLWTCDKCGNKFVNKNQFHSCRRLRLGDTFRGKPPTIRRLFDRFRKMVRACGPVTMLPYRDKVGFMVRVRFAGAVPAAKWLDIAFWLPRRIEHPRIHKIETIYPNAHIHRVRVTQPEQLDELIAGWIGEAYKVGCQEHLT